MTMHKGVLLQRKDGAGRIWTDDSFMIQQLIKNGYIIVREDETLPHPLERAKGEQGND